MTQKGRLPSGLRAADHFQRVLQAGGGQRGEFEQVLLEIGQAQNVAQPDAHQFGL